MRREFDKSTELNKNYKFYIQNKQHQIQKLNGKI